MKKIVTYTVRSQHQLKRVQNLVFQICFGFFPYFSHLYQNPHLKSGPISVVIISILIFDSQFFNQRFSRVRSNFCIVLMKTTNHLPFKLKILELLWNLFS